jgi:hypothetical protein
VELAAGMTRPNLSIVVGSDTLGWAEVGADAQPGVMTKTMPGGDGSFEFVLPGSVAWRHRNLLVPVDSRVICRVNGEPVWGGRIACDPVRHRLSVQDDVPIACVGLYGLAARNSAWGYIGCDTDLDRWVQFRNVGDHSGKFTVHKEEWLELRSHSDRSWVAGDAAQLYYWLHDGLLGGVGLYDIHFEYKLTLGASWVTGMWAGDGGPTLADPGSGSWLWVKTSADSPVAAWTADSFLCSGWNTICLKLMATGAQPGGQGHVKVRNVKITQIHAVAPLFASTVGDILTDMGAQMGADDIDIDATLAAATFDEFVSRYPTTVAETLRRACELYSEPIEAFFDLSPSGTERFIGRVRPAADALSAENRRWVVGGRGGEDTSQLAVDWETTPDHVQVAYAIRDDATLPDGTVAAVLHPGLYAAMTDAVEVVDLADESALMTEAAAENYARALYEVRHTNRYSGQVTMLDEAHTAGGALEPTWRLRPGDRLTALDRDDTDLFGETLYVSGTSFDWRTMTATATVGDPWLPNEPDGTPYVRPHHSRMSRRRYKTRRGLA